jgi:hypothetical protein
MRRHFTIFGPLESSRRDLSNGAENVKIQWFFKKNQMNVSFFGENIGKNEGSG